MTLNELYDEINLDKNLIWSMAKSPDCSPKSGAQELRIVEEVSVEESN
jgi:hypothetical protein